MTAKPQPSLKEWVAEFGTPKRHAGFIGRLPDDIRNQIRATADDPEVSTQDVVAWLHTLGFDKATVNIVSRYRTDVKHGRA